MRLASRAFTLVELMVVLVIVGILATIAVNSFFESAEKARDREAQANLKLISAAEKIYRLENNGYVALNNAAEINQVLRLTIPVDNKHWTYSVTCSCATCFTATAQRNWSKTPKSCTIDQDDDEPACS